MGVAGGVHFPWEFFVIIFRLDYKIEKYSQLAHFCSTKFSCNRCVWSTVAIFTYKHSLEMLLLSMGLNMK